MIRSRKYLDGARGANCTIRIPGVCRNETETSISAHLRDCNAGRSLKASDISTASCCYSCHEVLDSRAKLPSGEYLSEAEWLFFALRGLQETLEQRHEAGLLIIPLDAPKPSTVKIRKPKSERTKIPSRQWPKRQIRREI